MIHCIGDSHTKIFVHPFFKPHYIGPVTAYNISKHQSAVDSIKLASGDRVMLIVGEIDCRAHVVKQSRLQGRAIEDIAHEVANKLFEFIQLNASRINPIIWGPYYSHEHTTEDAHSTIPFYPVGSIKERKLAIDCYNARLKELSQIAGMPFVTVCGENIKYSDGIHMAQSSLHIVISKMKNLNLL